MDIVTFFLMVASLIAGTFIGMFVVCLCIMAKRGDRD